MPVFDSAAQHERTLALHDFLDLRLDQWESWLENDMATCPKEVESNVVSIIHSLRTHQTDDYDRMLARGDYMQAVASWDTKTMRYFIGLVGKYPPA